MGVPAAPFTSIGPALSRSASARRSGENLALGLLGRRRPMSTWSSRLSFALRKNRGLVVVVLAALCVRLVWNLAIHPPADFAVSDMAGYLKRADDVFLWRTRPEP